MGGRESKSGEILKFIDKEWEYLKTSKSGIKIYRNRYTDNEAELHTIGIEQKMSLQKEYDIYNYRRTQDNALVCVYAVQNLKDTAPNLCGNRNVLKVMVETIPWRLSDLPKLSFRQSVYVLSQAIRGYDDCYSKVGQFEINEQMMGLNSLGKLKVWLTQFFGQNHPSDEKPILQITTANELRTRAVEQQQSMICKVISLVQKKCKQRYPSQFTSQLNNKKTFADAYQGIEQYCLRYQLEVPDRIIIENLSINEPPKIVHHLQFQSNNPPTNVEKSNFSFQNNQNNGARGTLIKQLSFQNNITAPQTYLTTTTQNPNIRTNSSNDYFYGTQQPINYHNSLHFKDRSQGQIKQTLGFQYNQGNMNPPSFRSGGYNFSYPQNNANSFSRQGYLRGYTQF